MLVLGHPRLELVQVVDQFTWATKAHDVGAVVKAQGSFSSKSFLGELFAYFLFLGA